MKAMNFSGFRMFGTVNFVNTHCCNICWSRIHGETDSIGISTAVSGASNW